MTEWISFEEAVHRTKEHLIIVPSDAGQLLRGAVRSGQIQGRGELYAQGRFLVVAPGHDPSGDPDVIRGKNGFFYERETNPAEVELASLAAWLTRFPSRFASLRPPVLPAMDTENDADGLDDTPGFESITLALKALGEETKGLPATFRDEKIWKWQVANGKLPTGPKTIQRYFRTKKDKEGHK